MAEQQQTTEEPGWVKVQQKTFTKWMNSHLRKKGHPTIENAQEDFETGINLMNLINALYGIDIPKHNKVPKMRPHKLDNITLALKMIDDAKVKTNFLKSTHLIDKDLKMILGMIWAIILDYQIKGISVEELTAKEGLLLWCQKKTAGYRDVKVENFTTSWQSGLAFCALIHRHRPDLIDYDSLSKDNAAYNLQLAFDVAEDKLGIPKLLDVEDLLNTARPDERSVMTYISEYFHCFAGQDLKENAARHLQKFIEFARAMEELQHDYERRVRALLAWVDASTQRQSDRSVPESSAISKDLFESHKTYLTSEKPPHIVEKLDCEALLADIQSRLQINGRKPYVPPQGLRPEDVDDAWAKLEETERSRGVHVRDNMFRFLEKSSNTIDESKKQEIEASFNHFDKDKSGYLDRLEFKAALSALSIPFKDENAFNALYSQVSEGNDKISKEQFTKYVTGIYEAKDTPDQLVTSFQLLADQGNTISPQQLNMHPLTPADIEWLKSKMPQDGSSFDFKTFTEQSFA